MKIEPHLALAPSALLSCAIPTGFGSVANRSDMRPGDTVVVIGVGGIGTGAIQGARIGGAAQIVAVDPVDFKQKSALQFGATHSAATVDEALDLVRDLTYGVMADAVVVSPSLITADDVRDAVKLTRKGGTCVLTGMTSQLTRSVNIDLQDFILMNKTLAGTIFGSCNPKSDIFRLARLYQTGQLQLDEMITRRYRLDDINDAYDDLLNGKIIRGIIDFGILELFLRITRCSWPYASIGLCSAKPPSACTIWPVTQGNSRTPTIAAATSGLAERRTPSARTSLPPSREVARVSPASVSGNTGPNGVHPDAVHAPFHGGDLDQHVHAPLWTRSRRPYRGRRRFR